jgi:hypothetical protein
LGGAEVWCKASSPCRGRQMLGFKSRGLLNPEEEGVKDVKAKEKVQAHVIGRVNASNKSSRCPINEHLAFYL